MMENKINDCLVVYGTSVHVYGMMNVTCKMQNIQAVMDNNKEEGRE